MMPSVRERRPPVGTAARRARAAHCRPPSRGAGMGPAALRTVSAIPMYGSRRTLGFPPRRNHLGTGGPSRRPPSAGCADRRSGVPLPARRSAWWLGRRAPCSASGVAPSATRRALLRAAVPAGGRRSKLSPRSTRIRDARRACAPSRTTALPAYKGRTPRPDGPGVPAGSSNEDPLSESARSRYPATDEVGEPGGLVGHY